MARLLSSLALGIVLLYPAAVYFGAQFVQPRFIAVLLASILLIRLLATDAGFPRWLLFAGLAYAGFAVWSNQLVTLLFYPAFANAVMLLIFAGSLFYPPSIVERIARMQQPDLPHKGIIYTRKVTQVWCVFFFINGCIALITALWSNFEVWSLYNGLITYLLMGLLLSGEYLYRPRYQN